MTSCSDGFRSGNVSSTFAIRNGRPILPGCFEVTAYKDHEYRSQIVDNVGTER